MFVLPKCWTHVPLEEFRSVASDFGASRVCFCLYTQRSLNLPHLFMSRSDGVHRWAKALRNFQEKSVLRSGRMTRHEVAIIRITRSMWSWKAYVAQKNTVLPKNMFEWNTCVLHLRQSPPYPSQKGAAKLSTFFSDRSYPRRFSGVAVYPP